ncbi:Porin Omp2b [Rhodoplanes serenus]|uniref:Porin n=1 Tax=Rhodoplanes serenus TaxID=200615 RepID=A0A447CZT4_9BRAD|nr:porin [Rhodoplanes serenus]VCU10758.1 Porin Omp2b [Rhodoplanes serenus]
MKMVKSLLLGSAAGLVAVVGAQAADLPVKAKPVEYVKVCSLYGAGFYYIPGTDICMKMGGYVRAQYYYNTGSGPSTGVMFGSASAQQSNLTGFANDTVMRTRAVWTVDTRSQTEWGTLRTYVLLGFNHDSPGGSSFGGNAASLYATRGFIQFAGFTFGKAQSFYDLWSIPAVSYYGIASSDTGDAGVLLAAYTAQLGNGVSATIALEEPRRMAIVNTIQSNQFTVGGPVNNDYGTVKWPDVVANIRVDQAWGSFQVMGALHDASAAYNFTNAAQNTCTPANGNGTITGSMLCGSGDSALGFAVGVGARVKTDFISRGDSFQFQVNYTEGATRYAIYTPAGAGSLAMFGGGNSLGVGWLTDGIYINNGSLELTKVLGVNASYEHVWTPALKTSLYGGWFNIEHSQAAALAQCASISGGPNTISNATNCDPDFSFWYIGSRTQWNIRPDFYMGVDVLYHRLETAFGGVANYTSLAGAPRPNALYAIENQDALSVTFRVHRDIVP